MFIARIVFFKWPGRGLKDFYFGRGDHIVFEGGSVDANRMQGGGEGGAIES